MLTPEGCRIRQERFLTRLEEAGIGGALISASRDIYYLTGVLPERPFSFPNLLFLGPGLRSWLVTGLPEGATENVVADEVAHYPLDTLYTLNPDHHRRLAERMRDFAARTPGLGRVGYQREALPHSLAVAFVRAASPREWAEVDEILQDLQLRKDADEVACIRRAVHATLAGYTRAQQVIRPGVTELAVMTECQAAAQRYSGQVHFYNGDFQCGTFGGFARPRPIESGELYIIDSWSDVDGYWSDLSRTWVVGGSPADLQLSIYEHLAGVLQAVPGMARVGRSTTEFWHELDARIREHPAMADRGLVHHGGHGNGLRVHEGPDLNRDRGGVFEVGNTFTCEPGFYSDELRQGIRIENDFYLSPEGVVNLSEYPLSIIADPA